MSDLYYVVMLVEVVLTLLPYLDERLGGFKANQGENENG